MTLCETFRELSHETWAFMGKARSVSHQPLEETITDNNIIEIKLRIPVQTGHSVHGKLDSKIGM